MGVDSLAYNKSHPAPSLPSLPDEILRLVLSLAIEPCTSPGLSTILVCSSFNRLGFEYLIRDLVLDSVDGLMNVLLCEKQLGWAGNLFLVFQEMKRFQGDRSKWWGEVKDRMKWVRSIKTTSNFDYSISTYRYSSDVHQSLTTAVGHFKDFLPNIRSLTISRISPGFYKGMLDSIPFCIDDFSDLQRFHVDTRLRNVVQTISHTRNTILSAATSLVFDNTWAAMRFLLDISRIGLPLHSPPPNQPVTEEQTNSCVRSITIQSLHWTHPQPQRITDDVPLVNSSILMNMLRSYPEVKELIVKTLVLGRRTVGPAGLIISSSVSFRGQEKKDYVELLRGFLGVDQRLEDIVRLDDPDAQKAYKRYPHLLVGGATSDIDFLATERDEEEEEDDCFD